MVKTFRFDARSPKSAERQTGDIPQIGLGTATLKGDECREAVRAALAAGCRMLDTALLYGNQEAVGAGLRESGVPRSEVWLTTKVAFFPPESAGVWMYDAGNVKGDEANSIDRSLKELGVDSVDLMLIHNPCANRNEYNAACLPHFFELFTSYGKEEAIRPEKLPCGQELRPLIINAMRQNVQAEPCIAEAKEIRRCSWAALEQAQREGKCKHIGVSNYPVELLREMQEYAEVMPAVNQLELHPTYASPELRRFAKDSGIVLTGYGTGTFASLRGTHPVVAEIATRLGVSALHVALRWANQSGVASIPRSRSEAHIRENLDVVETDAFVLSEQDMVALDGLNADHPFYWDPIATAMTVSS